MAAPTISLLNYTLINAADTNTGWTILTTADPDIRKEGTNSMSGIFRTDATSGYYTNGTAISAVGKHVRIWILTNNLPYMASEANGGYEMLIYDGTTTAYKTMFGSDTYDGGWFNAVIDTSLFTGITLANAIRWGARAQHDTSAKNAINTWMDRICYLDGYCVTGGSSGDTINLETISIADKGTTTLYGYGVVLEQENTYFAYGKLTIGSGTTQTYFQMDGETLVFADKPVADNFYVLSGSGTNCVIDIKDSIIKSAGISDKTRFLFDMTGTGFTLSMSGMVLIRADIVSFALGQSAMSNTFKDCGQIRHNGAYLSESVVKEYSGTTDSSSLLYNVNLDPDGYMDNMTFEKGPTPTHAIQFGTLSPTDMTLRGCTFIGYNASNSQTDSTFYIARTGGTVTINLVGCSGNMTYKSAGAIVVLVVDPVTLGVTVKDIDTGDPLQFARVLIKVADGANFPYNDTVSITSSGTVATVLHPDHGLETNDFIVISGVNSVTQDVYNGVHQITVTGLSGYTYTLQSSTTSPATGTPTATLALISGQTDINGRITDSRTYSSDQLITGWVRLSTTQPYYKQQPVSDTVDSTAGKEITVLLIKDE